MFMWKPTQVGATLGVALCLDRADHIMLKGKRLEKGSITVASSCGGTDPSERGLRNAFWWLLSDRPGITAMKSPAVSWLGRICQGL